MAYFEQYKVGDVTRFGRYEVERDEILDFAKRFDPQPAHLSDEGAAGTVFGKLAASGWHSCAISMAMNVVHMQGDGATPDGGGDLGAIGIGADELRWLKPVYPGNVLYCVSEVLETRPHQRRPDKGFVRVRHQMFNQHDECVVSYILDGLFPRRTA